MPAGTVVGSSSLGDVDTVREHVHLGWTMYGSRWWGTQVNPESKLLLLAHAFDTCGFGRVKIQTDVINARSRAAILKLGATFEGITRRDVRRPDGVVARHGRPLDPRRRVAHAFGLGCWRGSGAP